jgi:hypothetical protein
MKDMSIDEIVNLYKDGYIIENLENNIDTLSNNIDMLSNNIDMLSNNIDTLSNNIDTLSNNIDTLFNIVSMDYGSQCSGASTVAFNNTGSLMGTYGTVQRGMVWAQRFNSDFRCLDFVQFSVKRLSTVDLYIEIRKDSGGKPQGTPAINDTGLIYRTPTISYNDLPTSFGWVYFNVSIILPTNGDYWVCFVPTDFFDSPTYRTSGYDRFELQDGTTLSENPSSHYDSGVWTNSSTFAFAVNKLPTYVIPSFATIYDLTTSPAAPTEGTSLTIGTSIANTGGNGKVRVVIKVNGIVVSGGDQNSTLNTYPGGGLWNPSVTYLMSATTITITVDSYGSVDNGATWTFNQTRSISVTPGALRCSGINLTPYSASVEIGQSVTFTATTSPSSQVFTVNFRLVETGASLGTKPTSGGTCQLIWNTNSPPGLVAGTTYHVIAEVVGQCWSTSPGSGITLSAPIQQWTLSVNVKNANTLLNLPGASVTISANGPPVGTQTLTTDLNGNAQFLVTQGTIDVTISKTGYNTLTTADSMFNNKSLQYSIVPTTSSPGSLKFITVPSGAEIFLGGVSKGTTDITTGWLQIDNLPAGQVIIYTAKKTGYNDITGSATVQSGTVVNVMITLTVVTPTTGDVCMKSNPSGASIKINGTVQTGKTTALSAGGCVPSNIIHTLTPTSHSYELSLAGFQNKTGNFTPTVGTTIQVDAGTLTPLPTMGSVTMTSTPAGARIYIDDVDSHYTTPATIPNIVQGPHTYKLTLSGYVDKTGNFTITAGGITTVPNVILVQRLGNLRFFSTPVGAEIFFGTTSKGVTTVSGLTVSNLPIGPTDFIARLTNYDEYHGNVIVEEGITKDTTFVFTPSVTGKGSLHIESTPPGAEIFIDGVDKLLTTPQTFAGMDIGGHEYKLVLSGYQTLIETFVISVSQTTTITKTLQSVGGGEAGGVGTLFGIIGVAALGIMMTAKKPTQISRQ